MTRPDPQLQVHQARRPEAVALILHGGQPDSFIRTRPWDPAVLRMIPFGRAVTRATGGRVAVATLRYAVRGWNDPQQSALRDTRWALAQLTARFPGVPIGLVGHSLGGRVALRVADHGPVRSVAALAPWLPDGEPIAQLTGRHVLLVHGTADRMTSPAATTRLAAKLEAEGVDVRLVELPRARHAMLRDARRWHGLVATFLRETLLAEDA